MVEARRLLGEVVSSLGRKGARHPASAFRGRWLDGGHRSLLLEEVPLLAVRAGLGRGASFVEEGPRRNVRPVDRLSAGCGQFHKGDLR